MKDVVGMSNEEEASETARRYEAAHFREVGQKRPSSWLHHLHGTVLFLFGLCKGLYYPTGNN